MVKQGKSNRKRVKSVYGMKSRNLFYKYAQRGGDLEQDIEQKKKEIKELEAQLAVEKSEERKRKIQTAINEAKSKALEIENRMKEMLKNVAAKASEAASKLSSGISSVASKLSSGASTVASKLSSGISTISKKLGITEMYNQYKNERAIKDYYTLKAKVVGQIDQLKRQKPKRDEICKRHDCNEIVLKKYPSAGDVFNEPIGVVPRLYYK